MLSKLAVRRLTKLADYMDSLPLKANKHFDMGSWFGHVGEHSHGIRDNTALSRRDLTYCGTTTCAAGWACTIPSFRKAGLVLIKNTAECHGGYVEFDGAESDALQRFFEINDGDVSYLFAGDVFASTPKQWAKHCRKFLRDNA